MPAWEPSKTRPPRGNPDAVVVRSRIDPAPERRKRRTWGMMVRACSSLGPQANRAGRQRWLSPDATRCVKGSDDFVASIAAPTATGWNDRCRAGFAPAEDARLCTAHRNLTLRRQFENQRLRSEEVAEFNYRPTACRKTHRMVVVKKNISVEKGETLLFDRVVYFFYITNDWVSEAAEIVFSANDRCDQENVLAQLSGGVRALRAPVDNLESNWAYMVMTALAWNLKAWWALTLPERPGRYQEKHRAEKRWVLRLEFKTFVNAFVRLPCQIVRGGRKLIYRLLGWNPHQPIFFRLVDVLRC
jgi:hypothetical protein